MNLEKVLYEFNSIERISGLFSPLHSIDVRAKLLVTILFLISVLSLSLSSLSGLILFCVYPIISCAISGISYGQVFRRSLWVLPFIAFIGLFNPILDKHIVFYIGSVGISAGWISFISIVLRGLLSVQAVFILVLTTGFHGLCHGMQRLGVPVLFTTQLLLVYRYIFVLLQEVLNMQRAIAARGFGRKSYSFRFWGIFIGQLLIRTMTRSERIYQAMLARGFSGSIKTSFCMVWKKKDTLYLLVWGIVFVGLRMLRPNLIFF